MGAGKGSTAQAACAPGATITAITEACYGNCAQGCNATATYR